MHTVHTPAISYRTAETVELRQRISNDADMLHAHMEHSDIWPGVIDVFAKRIRKLLQQSVRETDVTSLQIIAAKMEAQRQKIEDAINRFDTLATDTSSNQHNGK